ncbi:MAG: hypothetical protein BIFFINMI_04003 [Phycisphaerae bacterium]|nr:hypothetical protein [Phycisphaerae bacterium]
MAKDNQINFLPEDYLEKRRQQRTNILCLVLFGVVMAGLIGAFMLVEKRQAAAADDQDRVNTRLADVGQQLAWIDQMEKQKQKMIHKADVTASLLERRPRHYIIAEITNALPNGAGLTSVELTTKEEKPKTDAKTAVKNSRTSRAVKPARPDDEPTPMKVTEQIKVMGMAANDKVVSKFIANLGESELFDEVNLLFSKEFTYDKEVVRQFLVLIDVNENVQVTPEMARNQKFKAQAMK